MLPHYIAFNMYFADMLQRFVYINDAPYFLLILSIPFFIWQISKYFIKGRWALIPPIIALISPWFWYEVYAHSYYILILFFVLAWTLGLLIIRKGRSIPGSVIVLLASFGLIYASSLFFLFVPLMFMVLFLTKILELKDSKYLVIGFILISLPLLFFISKGNLTFKDGLKREVQLFSDPGLINTVNRYQGAAMEDGLRLPAKLSENKYIFYTEFLAGKYLNQFMPETMFTPQYKLLGFSFNSPIFLGFLLPFAYGLWKLMQKASARKVIFVSSLLALPSVLAIPDVSLNRLILILPMVAIIITFGIQDLMKQKGKTSKLFLNIFALLIIFQLVVSVHDLITREGKRSFAYYGDKITILEP